MIPRISNLRMPNIPPTGHWDNPAAYNCDTLTCHLWTTCPWDTRCNDCRTCASKDTGPGLWGMCGRNMDSMLFHPTRNFQKDMPCSDYPLQASKEPEFVLEHKTSVGNKADTPLQVTVRTSIPPNNLCTLHHGCRSMGCVLHQACKLLCDTIGNG